MQNQDLLMNFNFLLHENKHLNNVVTIYFTLVKRSQIKTEILHKNDQ